MWAFGSLCAFSSVPLFVYVKYECYECLLLAPFFLSALGRPICGVFRRLGGAAF